MSKPILVPLDGSPFAERVLPLAIDLAHLYGCGLHLLRVVSHESRLEAAGSYLKSQADFVRTNRLECREEVLIGSASDSIIKHSEDCELVAMASHGFSQYHTLVLGCVAQEVLRGARCPVFVVKDKALRLSQCHHILVPLDGHPLSRSALAYGERIAKSTGGELVLCRVSDRHGIPSETISPEAESEEVDRFLADTARTLDPALKVRTLHEYGSPSRCLLAQLESGVDLVVLTSHGEGGFNRWLCGSVAENLVRGSSVPLLVVRVDPQHQKDLERELSASSS